MRVNIVLKAPSLSTQARTFRMDCAHRHARREEAHDKDNDQDLARSNLELNSHKENCPISKPSASDVDGFSLLRCGSFNRRVPDCVSASSLDHDSKRVILNGPQK
ncbi:hypothetical protein AVEN_264532-1 [Araneus ventricosus]|uniref:Uncharacterized protein n=1 Tax=Araneus ventricosus TaxID=182803 RepID=A0A4Y2G9J8_ARAVE|nr:hypothetical protein AVEN_264532-1 [Araneus ventricosus]